MRALRSAAVCSLILALCRCDCNGDGEADSGSTLQDAARVDSTQVDHAAGQDHAVRDSAPPHDSAVADSHAGDSAVVDSQVADGGNRDSQVADGAVSDGRVVDSAVADSAAIDSQVVDAHGDTGVGQDSAPGSDAATADGGSSDDAGPGSPIWSVLGVGEDLTDAIAPDGTLWLWGYGCAAGPCQVGTDSDWSAVGRAGAGSSCAIKNNGTLWCWGRNLAGELGVGDFEPRNSPTEVSGGGSWLQVEAGGGGSSAGTCALKSDHSLWCWGLAGVYTSSTPVHTDSGTAWQQIATSDNGVCGTRTGGEIFCSDPSSGFAQLGSSATWLHVSTAGQICALNAQHEIWCWANPTAAPTQVAGGHVWTQVTVGNAHACALDDSAAIWCWGDNAHGELGTGNNDPATEPVLVVGDALWRFVQTRHQHTCGIRTDDTLWCWGTDKYGQLGDGQTTNRNAPIQVFRP